MSYYNTLIRATQKQRTRERQQERVLKALACNIVDVEACDDFDFDETEVIELRERYNSARERDIYNDERKQSIFNMSAANHTRIFD